MRRFVLGALTLAGAAFALWLALTSFSPGPWVASWAPCPRNWGWIPAWLPRASPLAAVPMRFGDGHHAKLCYGRPSLRGRVMIGGDAVPFGRLWRLGANEPTTIHLDGPAELGDLHLLPGSYSLYAIPGDPVWELIVNSSTRQWGIESEYTAEVASHEVGRLRLVAEKIDRPVETLTVRAIGAGADGFDLVFEWQTTRLVVPLSSGFGDS
jgi:hypothetical protein